MVRKNGTHNSFFGFLEPTKYVSKFTQSRKAYLLPSTNLTITEDSREVVPIPAINTEQLMRYYS